MITTNDLDSRTLKPIIFLCRQATEDPGKRHSKPGGSDSKGERLGVQQWKKNTSMMNQIIMFKIENKAHETTNQTNMDKINT